MTKIKFRSNISEVSEQKSSDAFIDLGATHHLFYSQSAFMNYSVMKEETVIGVTGVTEIAGKVMVQLPIYNGMIVEAYHAPVFSSNILAVRLLSNYFEVLCSNSFRDYPGVFLMKKISFNIVKECPLKNGHYLVKFNSMKLKFQAYSIKTNLVDQWHRKLRHVHPDFLQQLFSAKSRNSTIFKG